jgi:hypothetical protein
MLELIIMTPITRTPYNQLPIALTYRSIDRKMYRKQYCLECGFPFIAISDKYVAIQDGGIAVDMLREDNRLIEVRCHNHNCKQFYRIDV